LIEPSLFEDNPETENNRAIEWLLQSEDPSVRYFTLTDLLTKPEKSLDVEKTRRLIPSGPRVRTYLKDRSLTVVLEFIRIRSGPAHIGDSSLL